MSKRDEISKLGFVRGTSLLFLVGSQETVMVEKKEFSSKLQNFWYYNKVQTIIAVVAVVFIAVIIFNRPPSYDYQLAYVVMEDVGLSQENALNDAFLPYLYGADGKKNELLVAYFDLSERNQTISPDAYSGDSLRFSAGVTVGEFAIFLMDPSAYEQFKDYMAPVEPGTQTTFSTQDGIGWSWAGTELYDEANLGDLREDMILCVRKLDGLQGATLKKVTAAQTLFSRILRGEKTV